MAIQEHLWEFPHDMQLKVMGAIDSPLEAALIEILNTHLEDFDADKHLNSKPSSKAPSFLSLRRSPCATGNR
jgi:putative lipoic acid-binding regulatory protein